MPAASDTGVFDGAKVAILSGYSVVALLRDDRPDIAWPGLWDLPGGGREGAETPQQTVIREVREETGLRLAANRLTHRADYPLTGGRTGVLFLARWPGLSQADLRLGDEGQAIALMSLRMFLDRADAIPHLQARLRAALG